MSSALRALAGLRKTVGQQDRLERCDFCSTAVTTEHAHVLELASRRLSCACPACALLFDRDGGRYRRVPRRIRALSAFRLTDAQWESLAIPIQLAFFLQISAAERIIAFYPSPAGATECSLELHSWEEIAAANPILREIQPDVEALLVNRIGATRDHYLVPIDECYKLVGLIRNCWRGFSGGSEVWKQIDGFFGGLQARAGRHHEAICA